MLSKKKNSAFLYKTWPTFSYELFCKKLFYRRLTCNTLNWIQELIGALLLVNSKLSLEARQCNTLKHISWATIDDSIPFNDKLQNRTHNMYNEFSDIHTKTIIYVPKLQGINKQGNSYRFIEKTSKWNVILTNKVIHTGLLWIWLNTMSYWQIL